MLCHKNISQTFLNGLAVTISQRQDFLPCQVEPLTVHPVSLELNENLQ